jgi:hypothetical protein
MSDVQSVRQAIVDIIKAQIPDMNGYRNFTDITNVPAVIVGAPKADFTKAMGRGIEEWEFPIYVLVGIPEVTFAQDGLDEFVGPSGDKSIREILFENSDLNGTVEDSMIKKMDNYGGTFETVKKPLIPHVGACLYLTAYFAGN